MYLLTPYLASINNLSSAVVKTVDKTMKITYMLTEESVCEAGQRKTESAGVGGGP